MVGLRTCGLVSSKCGDDDWARSMSEDAWIDRYDVGRACLGALPPAADSDARYRKYHLVGAPGARKVFDVERTEAELGVRFTTEFDRRPGGRRD